MTSSQEIAEMRDDKRRMRDFCAPGRRIQLISILLSDVSHCNLATSAIDTASAAVEENRKTTSPPPVKLFHAIANLILILHGSAFDFSLSNAESGHDEGSTVVCANRKALESLHAFSDWLSIGTSCAGLDRSPKMQHNVVMKGS